MEDKVLKSRGRALEESFFARRNEELLQKLRQKQAAEERRQALAAVSGITDDAVLDRLIELELCAETVAAAALVPLVEVAWADGAVQDREREAILRAAEESGIDQESTAHQLLENWLAEAPEPTLMDVWRDYVNALAEKVGGEEKEKLQSQLLGRARAVAEAAGGFLGLGKISAKEQAVLEQLEKAFS
jgi:hypothetical protein